MKPAAPKKEVPPAVPSRNAPKRPLLRAVMALQSPVEIRFRFPAPAMAPGRLRREVAA